MNGSSILVYDKNLLKQAMFRRGLSFQAIGKKAGVSDNTAKSVVMRGRGQIGSVYKVAKALGFDVKPDDFSAIMKRRKSA